MTQFTKADLSNLHYFLSKRTTVTGDEIMIAAELILKIDNQIKLLETPIVPKVETPVAPTAKTTIPKVTPVKKIGGGRDDEIPNISKAPTTPVKSNGGRDEEIPL